MDLVKDTGVVVFFNYLELTIKKSYDIYFNL